jgi:SAM-dependent methyltransferase
VTTTPRADYDTIGRGYASRRVADPRISDVVSAALGDARRILDVGAGAGSYEPADRRLVALDASPTMLAQRRVDAAPAVVGMAERLPFADRAFDAVMAVLTVHHWTDRQAGYGELRRVAPRRVVLTYEPAIHNAMWVVADYVPEIATLDEQRPGFCVDEVAEGIRATRVETVPVPGDCTDGFIMAFWRRPEAFLDPTVRAATSGFPAVDQRVVARAMARLRADLESGVWEERYGALRATDEFDAGLRLVVADG